MKITVIGRGNVGGGLAKRWRDAGHDVQELGRDGGDASDRASGLRCLCRAGRADSASYGYSVSDFFSFRWMLTPVLIEALFVLGALTSIAAGFVLIGHGASHHHGSELWEGIGLVVLGPVVIRLYSELLIVAFRINGTLSDIRALAIWTAEREHDFEETDLEDGQES